MKLLAMISILALFVGMSIDLRKLPADDSAEYVLVIEDTREETEKNETIRLKNDDRVITIPLEEYLIGVVLTEMPSSFAKEAMKAQAIAARTFALRTAEGDKHTDADVCSSSLCCQGWRSDDQLRQAFGADYDACFEKGKTAVQETDGLVLTYHDELIEALYYSCSGGKSEDAVAVWGTNVPYLRSVESPGEEKASKFSSEVRVPFREFCRIIEKENGATNFSVIPQDWIGKIQYTKGGGIASIELGGVPIEGTKLRKLFGLASTKFRLQIGNGEMIFHVQGYGHRVGMSQYGAEAMAVLGADYKEILTHYYTGVSIKKLPRN